MIDYLRDSCVSEEVGKAMSALCCIFDISFISSTTPFQEKLIILHEYVRLTGSNAGFTSVNDVPQFSSRHSFVYPVVAFLGRRLLVLTVRTVDNERGFFRQNMIKTDA